MAPHRRVRSTDTSRGRSYAVHEPSRAVSGSRNSPSDEVDDDALERVMAEVPRGGPIETPTLSHQNKEYLARQLRAFRDGSRRNDIYTRMRSVAEKLSDREVERLATFYATTLSY